MPTTKKGEKISWDEFFKRWKKGIEGVTQSQKIKTQLSGAYLQLMGVSLGLIISIMGYKLLWWVGIILLGALINVVVQIIGLKQQKYQIEKIESISEEKHLEELFEDED
jgi:uncharacterized protein YacL